jgi:hypothetical protein
MLINLRKRIEGIKMEPEKDSMQIPVGVKTEADPGAKRPSNKLGLFVGVIVFLFFSSGSFVAGFSVTWIIVSGIVATIIGGMVQAASVKTNYQSPTSLAVKTAGLSAIIYMMILTNQIFNSVSSTAGLGFVFGPFVAIGVGIATFLISWPMYVGFIKTSLGQNKTILILFMLMIAVVAATFSASYKY